MAPVLHSFIRAELEAASMYWRSAASWLLQHLHWKGKIMLCYCWEVFFCSVICDLHIHTRTNVLLTGKSKWDFWHPILWTFINVFVSLLPRYPSHPNPCISVENRMPKSRHRCICPSDQNRWASGRQESLGSPSDRLRGRLQRPHFAEIQT